MSRRFYSRKVRFGYDNHLVGKVIWLSIGRKGRWHVYWRFGR